MPTINISGHTKERFKQLKIEQSAKDKKVYSEEAFMSLLLDSFQKKK